MLADPEQIKQTLQLFYQPGDTVELRCFLHGTVNGFYRDHAKLAADSAELNNGNAACYVVLNPVQADLAKQPNELQRCGKGDGAADQHAICRRWIVIDCDPIKAEPKQSATDAERKAAEQLASQVHTYLTERGLPAPVVATSGNGYWLLYRLNDLANDSSTRWALRQLLQHLADQFDNQAAVVDKTTFSAAQLVTLLGTVKRKGEHSAERPHRLSQLMHVPEPLQAAAWQQIVAITGDPPAPQQPQTQPGESTPAWDIEQLLEQRGLQYTAEPDYITASGEQATRYELEQCPWNNEHSDRSAWLLQWQSGAVAAGCHHNGCAGKGWQELKVLWQLPPAAGISREDIQLPPGETAPGLLILRSLDVEPQPIAWLWQDRFVVGGINLCCGRGGIGKTYFLCDLVARITNEQLSAPNGDPLLHGRVLYATGEDHLHKIIEPRMQQHAVDRSRLEYICGLPSGKYVQLLDVIQHCDLLRESLSKRPDTVALVLDPVTSFQGGADSNKVAAVRQFTAVLTQLSEEYNLAVLGVHHFNKGRRDIAGDSISGSHAYRDAGRSIWLFGLDKQDSNRRLMVCDKHNWAERRPSGLAYRIENGRIAYEAEPLDMSCDELLAQGNEQPVDIACAWLMAQLSNGPQPAVNVQIAATTEDIKPTTLKRAKKRLGVQSVKQNDSWIWALPTAANGQGDQ